MIPDQAGMRFLQWCVGRLGLRWQGYRRVRRLVCKRLNRRMAEIGLGDFTHYQSWIIAHPEEWVRIDAMCRIPISRFYRDRDVFRALGEMVLPDLARHATAQGRRTLRCWSAGCASGEEPYSLLLLWHYQVARDWPELDLALVATDADDTAISRAKTACYGASSLKELPQSWLLQSFERQGDLFCLREDLRDRVVLRLEDIREAMPNGPFELILCRNLVFTYFSEAAQRQVLDGLVNRLAPGGYLVLGKHETLPPDARGLTALSRALPIFRQDSGQPSLTRQQVAAYPPPNRRIPRRSSAAAGGA